MRANARENAAPPFKCDSLLLLCITRGSFISSPFPAPPLSIPALVGALMAREATEQQGILPVPPPVIADVLKGAAPKVKRVERAYPEAVVRQALHSMLDQFSVGVELDSAYAVARDLRWPQIEKPVRRRDT